MTGRRDSPASRLRAVFTSSGGLARLEADGLSLIQYPATELEPGPANVWLRIRTNDDGPGDPTPGAARYDAHPLTGPASGSRVATGGDAPTLTGRWRGLAYTLTWLTSATEPAWAWRVRIVNESGAPLEVDLVGTLDAALAPWGQLRRSELYVSQYLDCTPVDSSRYGVLVAVRQNMPGPTAPWLAFGSLKRGVAWSTDARQLADGHARADATGDTAWPGLLADLPSRRLQHEHTLVAVQDAGCSLAPGQAWEGGFAGWFVPDHPEATGPYDAARIESVPPRAFPDLATAPAPAAEPPGTAPTDHASGAATLFSPARFLDGRPATEADLRSWVPGERRQVEHPRGDRREPAWAFVTDGPKGAVHVVTDAKERSVLRPHGHVLRSPSYLAPAPDSAASTCWMRGVFHSHVVQGHASLDSLVTLQRGYLGLRQAHGSRVFVDTGDGTWRLLRVPSAWAIEAGSCRWWYRLDAGTLLVTATARPDRPEFDLTVEPIGAAPVRLLLATALDDGLERPTLEPAAATRGGVRVTVADGSPLAQRYPTGGLELSWAADVPLTPSADEVLFVDGVSRGLNWLCLRSDTLGSGASVRLRLSPALVTALAAAVEVGAEPGPIRLPTLRLDADTDPGDAEATCARLEALDGALPWLAGDALVHYLTPRGLEQFTGGAWGTRDVCQGPVGLLLAGDRIADLRTLVLRIFAGQQEGGAWPQWFEFQPAHRSPGWAPCHGDVPYWPLLALGDYLRTTGDSSVLSEPVPYVGRTVIRAEQSLLEHVERAMTYLAAHLTPDRRLPAYGHGDWNDALQPADPQLAAHLSSTWTATLAIQAYDTLAQGLDALADPPAGLATRLRDAADATREGLCEVMLHDGELAGYVLLDDTGHCVEHLVHPADRRTGLRHGLLPAIHAVAGDLLTPEGAADHLAMIRQHLHGTDGARLFDRPAVYSGGPTSVFLRAEAASFWGREIGLMYTHAHLRYVEALARAGAADEAFGELLRVIPLGLPDRVAGAAPRQSTCYASSSDAAFTDRYDAAERYAQSRTGKVPLEAGWRVYSSGPGLILRLVTETLLGWRRRRDGFDLDPCLPPALDGLRAAVPSLGETLEVCYRIGPRGTGVRRVTLDDRPLATTPLRNPYRDPGVHLRHDDLAAASRGDGDAAASRRVLTVELG